MDEQQQPNMLIQFQASVLNGQTNEIHAFIEALAQEASNKYLEALATEYKFVTFWDPALYQGKRIMLARDLAQLCYGTDETNKLGELCRRHGFAFLSIQEATSHIGRKLQLLLHFSLSKFASHQRFVTWDHVLIAAANGETEFARKVWSFIQANIMYALADLESRRQTGKGVQENVAEQVEKAKMAGVLRDALDELRAKKELLLEMGYHPSMALMQATKHAERQTGLDLTTELNDSPLMKDIPEEERYTAVSKGEKRFGIPQKGQPGQHLNELLCTHGLQRKLPDGSWQPTARAEAEHYCISVLQTNKAWQGHILHWKIDLIARIAEWLRRTGGNVGEPS